MKIGDRVKLIATDKQLESISICCESGDGLRRGIGIITDRLSFIGENYGYRWRVRFATAEHFGNYWFYESYLKLVEPQLAFEF